MPKYMIRYGSMRLLGVMTTRGGARYARGSDVIARTNRGLEAGRVLCELDNETERDKPSHGQILREMTADDANELAHIQASAKDEFLICVRHVKDLRLDMQLVEVEHLFGGERVIIYYLAEGRVDFRELVKRLASEFQTRIEMRQIGVRDEAKLLADFGDCGKSVCCNTHLSEMPPVSMKMAKLQKATLDPTKISGRCGRLKCCLRYEYGAYQEMRKDLPPIGSEVTTRNGKARVLSHEILAQQVFVEMEDARRVMIDGSEILSVIKRVTKGKGNG